MNRERRAVIALTSLTLADAYALALQRENWSVVFAQDEEEARELTHEIRPDLVLLSAHRSPDAGFLMCDILTREAPNAKVVLISEQVTPSEHAYALLVGAFAIHDEEADPSWLLETIDGLTPVST